LPPAHLTKGRRKLTSSAVRKGERCWRSRSLLGDFRGDTETHLSCLPRQNATSERRCGDDRAENGTAPSRRFRWRSRCRRINCRAFSNPVKIG
jgi:hypothetical protein